MSVVLGIIAIAVLVFLVYTLVSSILEGDKKYAEWEKSKEYLDVEISKIAESYGEKPTVFIGMPLDLYSISNAILIFGKAKVVILNGQPYNFADILGWEIKSNGDESDTIISGTSTISKSSMAKRALVGGVLFGGIGAIAGAATAKRNTSAKVESDTFKFYNAYIYVNSLDAPMITFDIGVEDEKAKELGALLTVITQKSDSAGV